MRVLILSALPIENGEYEQVREVLQNSLKIDKYECEWINARELSVKPCLGTGCLACQFETPGLCKQEDDMEELYSRLVQSDLLFF